MAEIALAGMATQSWFDPIARYCTVITTTFPGVGPRGAVAALIRLGEGVIRVVGIHLGLLRGSRRAQLHRLSELLKGDRDIPTVVLRDFNERSLRIGLGRLKPSFTIADAGSTFHSRRPTFALDRIAYSSHLTTTCVGTLSAGEAHLGSDHLPVFADSSS